MKNKIPFNLIATILIFIVSIYLTETSKKNASIIIHSAVIYSVDEQNNIYQAIAIRGSRIIALGTNDEILSKYNAGNIIDAKGKTLIPGLIDSHAHLFGLAQTFLEVNLVGTTSSKQIVELLKESSKNLPDGVWIRGRGWDQNDWSEKKFPTSKELDNAFDKNPVILSRIDGHAIWVNSLAMRNANISTQTKEIDGGKIYRDASGNPNGIFVDEAMSLIYKIVPSISEKEISNALQKGFEKCLSLGLTSVHEMGVSEDEFNLLDSLNKNNILPIRIHAAASGVGTLWQKMLASKLLLHEKNEMLALRSIKLYVDGALGSRGAALIEPYTDSPDSRGMVITKEEEIKLVTQDALENNYQVLTHAIGDRGNKIVLNAYERALESSKNIDARLRIEHAQVIDENDFERFKKLKIIPSMQPTHCTSDMYWAQARLGQKRIRNAYAWRKFLNDGNIIPSGSDFPVEEVNPLFGFYAAITRQDKNGNPKTIEDVRKNFELSPEGVEDSLNFNNGWYVKELMTRQEALKSFTIWGAYAEKMEKEKGSLEIGKLADCVLLSENIMEVQSKKIIDTKIIYTIVNGKIKFSSK